MQIYVPTTEVLALPHPDAAAAARDFLKTWGPVVGLTDNFDAPSGTWAIRIEGDVIAIINPNPQGASTNFGADPTDKPVQPITGETHPNPFGGAPGEEPQPTLPPGPNAQPD